MGAATAAATTFSGTRAMTPRSPDPDLADRGFAAPLTRLAACHHRLTQSCAALQRLVVQLADGEPDGDARSTAVTLMADFDAATRDHHADEEVDLFPALIESMGGSDATCIRALVTSLTADHRAVEAQWRCLRVTLAQLAAGGSQGLAAGDVAAFVASWERLLACEDTQLLPMAARLLSDSALDDLGRSMGERRLARASAKATQTDGP